MKGIAVSIIFAGLLIGGAFLLGGKGSATIDEPLASGDNVKIVDGIQIIDVRAKGGYQPRRSVAKAGIPTILRFNTSGTFDCSAAVRIPSLGVNKILPQSGATDIDLGTPAAGPLSGSCGMGMYPFEIVFES